MTKLEKTALEIALSFSEKFQDNYPDKKHLWQLMDELKNEILTALKSVEPASSIEDKDLWIIRNKIVDLMPTGEVTAWDTITAVKEYLKWFDEYFENKNLSSISEEDKLKPDEFLADFLERKI